MKKDELQNLLIEEVRRSLSETDVDFDRMARAVAKYKPVFKKVTIDRRSVTICALKGSRGGIVSTGTAWKAPGDKEREDTGNKIAYSRAVRGLVAKRMGIVS